MEREPGYGRYRERYDDDDDLEWRERYRPSEHVYRGQLRHARDWRDVEPYGWARGPAYDERGYGRDWDERRGPYGWDEREHFVHGAMRPEHAHRMRRARDEAWMEPERSRRTDEEAEHRLADRIAAGIRSFFRRDREGGPHRGKGPKGYRRSDERIREDVCETIADTGWVDASDVEVRVQDGEVTLAGTVRARRDKRLLEDLVAQVPGVTDVHNQVRLRREAERAAEARRSSHS